MNNPNTGVCVIQIATCLHDVLAMADIWSLIFLVHVVGRAVLATFTPEQMSRYECYRRSGFQRANMRRVCFLLFMRDAH